MPAVAETKGHPKKKPEAVRIDKKNRVIIPQSIREALELEPGDTLLVLEEEGVIRLAKPENPFDGLARHAVSERAASRTITLDEWVEREGVTADDGE